MKVLSSCMKFLHGTRDLHFGEVLLTLLRFCVPFVKHPYLTCGHISTLVILYPTPTVCGHREMEKKLSSSQAQLGQATCLAVAYFLSISCGENYLRAPYTNIVQTAIGFHPTITCGVVYVLLYTAGLPG